jgi:hypothetical protein
MFSRSIMASVTLQTKLGPVTRNKMIYLKQTLNTIYIKYSHSKTKFQNENCVLQIQEIKIYKVHSVKTPTNNKQIVSFTLLSKCACNSII